MAAPSQISPATLPYHERSGGATDVAGVAYRRTKLA
jgi:hypothetical protein